MTGAQEGSAPYQAVATPDEARAVARAAEAAGTSLPAIRAWQVLLRLCPDDAEALRSLAILYEEGGDLARADACLKRLRAEVASTGTSPPEASPSESPPPEVPPPDAPPQGPLPQGPRSAPDDADLVRFLDRFGGREDVHARMWRNEQELGWSPVSAPLTVDLLRQHLEGYETFGVYCVTLGNGARFVCLDLDIRKAALDRVRGDAAGTAALRDRVAAAGRTLTTRLRERGLDPLLEDSGYKGRHVWLFLAEEAPAARVYALAQSLGRALQPADPDLVIEAFPRQPAVRESGLGSLIKLPLGVHLRTGRRGWLLDADGQPEGAPWERLRHLRRTSILDLEARCGDLVALAETLAPEPMETATPPLHSTPATRPWTEVDFETSPSVGPVLVGCAVLREIVQEALRARRMDHDGAVVLNHSLGHLPDGPRAVNYLYDQVPGFSAELRMGAPHRGSPVSCTRVRQRMGSIVDRVGCACTFHLPPGGYAHPLRHLQEVPAAPPPPPGIEECCDAYARALDHERRIGQELAELRRRLTAFLARSPDHRWRHGRGEWVLRESDGLPVVTWEADAPGVS